MFFLAFATLGLCEQCVETNVSKAVEPLLSLYVSFKNKHPINIFGIDTIPTFPQSNNFSEFVNDSTPFILGETNGVAIIFTISLLSVLVTIILTTICSKMCIAKESSSPGVCSSISYIFFTLVFGLAMGFYCTFIYYTDDFYSRYPRIPQTLYNAISVVVNEVDSIRDNLVDDNKCADVIKEQWMWLKLGLVRGQEGIMNQTSYFDLNNNTWKAIRPLTYIGFVIFIAIFICQSITFVTKTSFARCWATSTPIIGLIASVLIGIVAIVSTALGVASMDVCEKPEEFAQNFLTYHQVNEKHIEIPTEAFKNNSIYIDQALNSDECKKTGYIPSYNLSCGFYEVQNLFCSTAPAYFGTIAISTHAYLIALIGFSITILARRTGMLGSGEDAVFGAKKGSGMAALSFSRGTKDELYNQPSVDESDTDSYQPDIQSHVGFL